jgi:hypothetical protein
VNHGGCSPDATCVPSGAQRTCYCNPGFTGDGVTCRDLDECATSNGGCGPHATCQNTPGSFTCTCTAGYGSDAGQCVDVDECQTHAATCGANATCTNTPGTFVCACSAGFVGDGGTCVTDPCLTNHGGCSAHTECVGEPSGALCLCDQGYTPDGGACQAVWTPVQLVPVPTPQLAWVPSRHRMMLYDANASADSETTWELSASGWALRRLPPPLPPRSPYARLVTDTHRGVVVGLFDGATWEFDGLRWRQTVPPGSVLLNQYGSAAMAYDPVHQRVVLYGGQSAGTSTWLYDGQTWSQLNGASPGARSGAMMAFEPTTQRLVLFGGSQNTRLNDPWAFDGQGWTQLSVGAAPSARDDGALATDEAHGRVVLVGGESSAGLLEDTWAFDGTRWTQLAPTQYPDEYEYAGSHDGLAGRALQADPKTGLLLLVGGSHPNRSSIGAGYVSDQTWAFDGTTWRLATEPLPRVDLSGATSEWGHLPAGAVAAEPDGGIIVSSGEGVWRWSGTWQRVSPAAGPTASIFVDPSQNRLASVGTDATKEWSWSGSAWSSNTPSGGLTARPGVAAGYDVSHSRWVLFGGSVNSNYGAETWTRASTGWSQRSPATSPPARGLAAFAWDPVRQKLVLQGGWGPITWQSEYNPPLSDTWTWSGTTWAQVTTTGTAPSGGGTMTWDTRRQALLFLGATGTYTLTSSRWEPLSVGAPACAGALALDASGRAYTWCSDMACGTYGCTTGAGGLYTLAAP